jgi:hypothetical protein
MRGERMLSGETASMKKSLLSLILPVLLASCGTGPLVQGPPVAHLEPFHEGDYKFTQGSGTASLSGQLCIKFVDGHMIGGRHAKVELMPKTPYTKEIVNREFNLMPSDPRLAQYVRRTTADWYGNFAFHNVPAGDYVVCGVVDWKDAEDIPDEDDAGSTTAVGWWTNHMWSWKHVKVASGQAVHVIATQ